MLICKVKTFETYFIARHVNFKKKKTMSIRGNETGSQNLSGPQREDLAVFRVSDHVRLKPTYSVTEISSLEC